MTLSGLNVGVKMIDGDKVMPFNMCYVPRQKEALKKALNVLAQYGFVGTC